MKVLGNWAQSVLDMSRLPAYWLGQNMVRELGTIGAGIFSPTRDMSRLFHVHRAASRTPGGSR
jgi:hypothetical protein